MSFVVGVGVWVDKGGGAHAGSIDGSVDRSISHPSHINNNNSTTYIYTRRPKWQFHLLVGSIIFLLCSLVLMTVISVVYGFGMT